MIGQTIGHYRILDKLGAGGMGEVYRAEDLTLKRHVALKVLPPEVAGSQEKLDRFRREAETLAALDHPNIVTLYSVEEAEPGGEEPTPTIHFLTMQLVEGRQLSDQIPESGLPAAAVVEIGIELIEALRVAHEMGVIHRDLKPANVMLDREGRVKVLDFGLAKLRRSDLDENASLMATETMTQEGVILGTIPYMSPEQIQGAAVDRRTDLFSFGIILYEMLSGERPFQASNTAALMSNILRDPPTSIDELKPGLPPSLSQLIARCLEKDPRLRYQSAEEVWLGLKEAKSAIGGPDSAEIEAAVERVLAKTASEAVAASIEQSTTGPGSQVARTDAVKRTLPWLAVLVIVTGLGAAAYFGFLDRGDRKPESANRPANLSHRQFTSMPGTEQYPSLSPNGEWLVYSAEGPDFSDIYLQSVDGQKPFNLTEDSRADNIEPTFSPDGDRIAFRSSRQGGGIFVMGRTGEAVRRVSRTGFNPTWSPDGSQLAYATEGVDLNPLNWAGASEIWTVDLSTSEEARLDISNAVQPAWSPSGEHIAYVARMFEPTRMDLAVVTVTEGESTALTSDSFTEWSPTWSPDGRYLYFASDRSGSMNLWRLAVDPKTGEAVGEPEPLITPATYLAHASFSADGRSIAYSSVLMTQNVQRVGFDGENATVGEQAEWITSGSTLWSSVDASPDGEWLAFYTRTRPEGNLYVVRTDGSGLRQLTGDDAIDRVPRWSPDGDWISFFSDRSGSLQLWRIRSDGSDLQQLTDTAGNASLGVWSPSGSSMAVLAGLGNRPEIIVFDPDHSWGDQELEILPAPEDPDLRFVATSWSDDADMLVGQNGFADNGIFVFSFASGSYRRLTEFGEWPVWLPDSRQILFVSRGKDFFVVDVSGGEPRQIFSVNRDVIGPPRLSGDGSQIYFTRRVTEADVWLLTLGDS